MGPCGPRRPHGAERKLGGIEREPHHVGARGRDLAPQAHAVAYLGVQAEEGLHGREVEGGTIGVGHVHAQGPARAEGPEARTELVLAAGRAEGARGREDVADGEAQREIVERPAHEAQVVAPGASLCRQVIGHAPASAFTEAEAQAHGIVVVGQGTRVVVGVAQPERPRVEEQAGGAARPALAGQHDVRTRACAQPPGVDDEGRRIVDQRHRRDQAHVRRHGTMGRGGDQRDDGGEGDGRVSGHGRSPLMARSCLIARYNSTRGPLAWQKSPMEVVGRLLA
ncbi:hypothetical protein D3C86_1296750 [compost metagenome]